MSLHIFLWTTVETSDSKVIAVSSISTLKLCICELLFFLLVYQTLPQKCCELLHLPKETFLGVDWPFTYSSIPSNARLCISGLYLCSSVCLRHKRKSSFLKALYNTTWRARHSRIDFPTERWKIYMPRKIQWNGIIITTSMWENKSHTFQEKLTIIFLLLATPSYRYSQNKTPCWSS